MKDIVVIFVQTQDLNRPARPSHIARVKRTDELIIDNDSLTQFWTWFIENPRPGFSRSFGWLLEDIDLLVYARR